MDDYIKLIIFNIIIISLSFLFKKNIVLFYVFLLIFLLMFILTYMMILKNKLIEGNFQEELFESLDYVDSNKLLLRLPLDKISLILETMLEKLSGTKIENQNKCKGEFIINKLTNKTCGDGFNERVYKILDPGDGDCLHSELYKEKTPLKFCGYGEKCEKDLDCKSNRCNDELCDFELDCSETMLSGCKYDSCLALNSDLDKDLYFWSDNKCNVNPCNKNDFKMCDEGECNDLSYRFKYDKETKQCNEIVNEQGESTTEPESMNETYQRYTQAGGHEEICGDLNPGVESCSVGADLQPRYYCKGGYWNGEGEERGSKEPCVNAPGALERRWSADIVDAPTPDPIPSYIPPCVDYGQRSCPPCVTDANGQLCSNGTTRRNPGTGLCECQPCPPGYHGHNCNISQKCVDGQYLNEEKTGCVCDSSNGWYMLNGSCIECGDNQLLNEEKTGCVCDSSNGWGIDSTLQYIQESSDNAKSKTQWSYQTTQGGNYSIQGAPPTKQTAGVDSHNVVTFDTGANYLRWYRNGVRIMSWYQATANKINGAAAPIYIGNVTSTSSSWPTYGVQGAMGGVAIYDFALSQTEVTTHYNALLT